MTSTTTTSTATTPAASVDEAPEDGEGFVEDDESDGIAEEKNDLTKQRRRRLGGPRRLGGVRNIGNTCYLGAAVQTLANVSLLSGFLISNEQQFLHLPLVLRYTKMLRSLLVKKETASPVELKESVSELCSLFGDNLQHDSQEFMQFFLDALHESLKRTSSTAPSSAAFRRILSPMEGEEKQREENGQDDDGDEQQQQRNSKDQMDFTDNETEESDKTVARGNSVWQYANSHWKKEVLHSGRGSIVLDLFAGQFLSELSCPSCSHSSNTFELFTMLQLPIPASASLLVPFKVVRKCPTAPIVRYALRLPATAKVCRVKRLISERICIDISRFLVVILNKSDGKFNATFSRLFNDANSVVENADGTVDHGDGTLSGMPFIGDIDVWCFESDSATGDVGHDGGGGHLICVHRQFHFKTSFAVLALNGIGTYTFGTPIVLTFPSYYTKTQKSVFASQLYAMVLEYVQKRYSRNTESHSAKDGVGGRHWLPKLFNRALDANADSALQNDYPFALALTKSDAIWCYKCDWRRFCRGCPIDANSTDSFALDELLAGECLLTINWKNVAALYLLYNNLAERLIDDSPQASSAGAELLDETSPRISIDDCLADFTRAERIDGSQCARCSERQQSPMPLTKQLSFTQLPDILVVCFKRFTFVPSLRQFVKQIVPVSFPLDNFDPSKYFSSAVPAEILTNFSRYFCIAIVTHHGQLDYGHYCSYVRDFFSDEWFFCNDNKTFPIKSSEVDTRNAYIVFYQQVPSSAVAPRRNSPTI